MPVFSDFSDDDINTFQYHINRFIKKEFGDSGLVGLKDPRFCFTLPIWIEILERLGYKVDFVHTIRNPIHIFRSNMLLNKGSSARSFRITIGSILSARYFLKDKSVFFIDYGSLLNNPEKEITSLCKRLDLDLSLVEHAKIVVKPVLNHQADGPEVIDFNYFRIIHGQIESLETEYHRYREIALAHISAKDDIVAGLKSQFIEDPGYTLQLKDELSQKQKELIQKDEELYKMHECLENIISSRSLRITKPLRFITDVTKQIMQGNRITSRQ